MWKRNVLQSRKVRASAAVTGAAPSAPTPASANIRASAAAVAELADELDFLFDQINYEDEPGDLLQLHLQRLMQEAAKYGNSQLRNFVGSSWSCSPETAQLILAAAQCSSMVYEPVNKPGGMMLKPTMTRTPSATGTTKAMSVYKLEDWNALVVAVRGTASAADHIVNLNSAPRDASSVVKIQGTGGLLAHGGFLACADVLKNDMVHEIRRQLEHDPSLRQVVFTGHSAGGAVATLLFLHSLGTSPLKHSGVVANLITFGAPPVTSTNLTSLLRENRSVGELISFINEFDMVPRADRPYIQSIINLYRSRYSLSTEPPKLDVDFSSFSSGGDTMSSRNRSDWPLPGQEFHHVGEVVILQSVTKEVTSAGSEGVEQERARKMVCGVEVIGEELSTLLFCDLSVHKRRVYLRRIEQLVANMMPGLDEQEADHSLKVK